MKSIWVLSALMKVPPDSYWNDPMPFHAILDGKDEYACVLNGHENGDWEVEGWLDIYEPLFGELGEEALMRDVKAGKAEAFETDSEHIPGNRVYKYQNPGKKLENIPEPFKSHILKDLQREADWRSDPSDPRNEEDHD